jgi:soluble lytic murein transglycosylase-like protein
MPRARSLTQEEWQTAVEQESASGCLSFYVLPPLAVVVIVCLLTVFALKVPRDPAAALRSSASDISVTPSGNISPIFTKEVQHWGDDIVHWSNVASIDPNLVAVVMQIESCGDPRALSRSGAIGLFQVMPFHFHFGENPYNPEVNALRGLNYLSRSLQAANGDPRLALAGYNGGIGVISRGEWTWAAETLRYIRYGAPIYEDARSGAVTSTALTEWYQKYGRNLCNQASKRLGLN